MTETTTIFTLLTLFQIKHFISDYPLQNQYMLQKANLDKWVFPLLSHALVHASLTLLIVLVFNYKLWWLFFVDLTIHFVVDRIKASPKMLNRFSLDNKFFWWSLGIDQMMHHLTHYFIIFMIIKG